MRRHRLSLQHPFRMVPGFMTETERQQRRRKLICKWCGHNFAEAKHSDCRQLYTPPHPNWLAWQERLESGEETWP